MIGMDTLRILNTLREHAPELRSAGVDHLRLFGSSARGEARPTSDIDLLADFAPNQRITLLTLGGLQQRLTELVGAEVDLSSESWMKEPVRRKALEEAILAF